MAATKKRSLKASFVVTFTGSAAVLAAPGCYADVTSNPPPVVDTCPNVAPNSGDACASPGLSCPYDPCESPSFTCSSEGAWEADYVVSCNPPPVLQCPEAIPTHGDASCFGEGTCSYTDECALPVTATCPGGTWEVVYQGTCNPPAPCDLFGTAEDCALAGYCRWFTPGCGDPESIPALPEAGCYPLEACVGDADCSPGSACKQVMVTPDCVPEGCNSCGQAVSLCL